MIHQRNNKYFKFTTPQGLSPFLPPLTVDFINLFFPFIPISLSSNGSSFMTLTPLTPSCTGGLLGYSLLR